MTRTRIDLPDNFPDDWDVPDFQGGEAGELAMRRERDREQWRDEA